MDTSWHVLYPHPRFPWAGVGPSGALFYDPRSRTAELADPTIDRALLGLAPVLASGDLISYRPGRRAVLARKDSYVKVVPPRKLAGLVARHESFSKAALGAGFRVPEILWVDHDVGAVAFEAIDVPPLRGRWWRSGARSLLRVGYLLGRLAEGPVPENLPERAVDNASWWLQTVRDWDPIPTIETLRRIEAIFEVEVEWGPPAAVHGDLHDGNLLWDGETAALIDLDVASIGGAWTDLVSLLAHVELRSAHEGAVATHRDALAGTLVEGFTGVHAGVDLAPAVARELARLVCVYRFRRPEHRHSDVLLDRCEALLGGGGWWS